MKTQVLVMATAMALTVIACKKDNNLPVGDVPGDLLGSWVAVSYLSGNVVSPMYRRLCYQICP
ncbi:hypothetical protein [Chitinophaga agri]|uniref:Uncharacterized protein n=1 Tax=Chitinophaga agri TaxID=2703787 RepID=A0A6B9ZD00_9BACT|nr:hypothetical protein [Chitinophaga agri]QHS60250.1 hypothetical protein GWR21_11755 [Chitinophaga agri]